jgi:hypothetical protein
MEKSFRQPLLVNADAANLSDGSVCISAWTQGPRDLLKKLRIMRLDQRGNVLHSAEVGALRGQVTGGPEGSCAVLYDRAPSVNKADYYLTVFDRSFTRQWTVAVPRTNVSGAEFDLTSLAEGYLAQINNVLVGYDWTGKDLWSSVETPGTVKTIVTPTKEGFFTVIQDLEMNNGFRVKRATTTHP